MFVFLSAPFSILTSCIIITTFLIITLKVISNELSDTRHDLK